MPTRSAGGFDPLPPSVEEIGRVVLDAGFEVHRHLGPGLLESIYQQSLAAEVAARGVTVKTEVPVQVRYKDHCFDHGLRLDMVAGDAVVVEVKAVETVHPVHLAQLLTYLRVTGCRLGFLMNFNVKWFRNGFVRRVV